MNRTKPHIVGKFLQRSFDHLVQVARKRDTLRTPSALKPKEPFVHAKDRIPLWNISAGDTVRVNTGSKKGMVGTVNYVDRKTNRVYLEENEFQRWENRRSYKKNEIFKNPQYRHERSLRPSQIHYSNLSLVLDPPETEATDLEKESIDGILSSKPLIIAKRLRATNIRYDWQSRRWRWRRLAEGVAAIGEDGSHSLNWARSDRFTPFIRYVKDEPRSPSSLDTANAIATEATFVPPMDPLAEPPAELALRPIEFGEFHSRAKRAKRWTERKELERKEEIEGKEKIVKRKQTSRMKSRTTLKQALLPSTPSKPTSNTGFLEA